MTRKIIKVDYLPLLLILPALAMMISLKIIPVVWSLFTSTKSMSLLDLMIHKEKFIGLRNYLEIFKDTLFWGSLKRSLIFVGLSVVGHLVFGLLIAVILHNKNIKFPGLFRALFLIPWITTVIIAAYSWIYILDANLGFLPALAYNSSFLTVLGLGRRDWLTNPRIVLYVLAVINIWKGTAFSMLMQSAGLQSIPDSIYEAADVDGISVFQKFFLITIPLLRPFILVNLVMTTMITFNVYDLIIVITSGGPARASEVLSLYVYNTGFIYGELGYAAALTILLLIINISVTVIYLKLLRSREES